MKLLNVTGGVMDGKLLNVAEVRQWAWKFSRRLAEVQSTVC